MSQLLLSELAALSSEAKRKSPEVRAASDAALAALRSNADALFEAKNERAMAAGENVLLQPVMLACEGKTATAKVVGIAVGLLQRIIGLRIIRDADCPMVVEMLQHVVATRSDVDVQLKVLQAVSSLLSNYASVHHEILSKTLGLCFQLQDSRVGVVSSTAAATMRQAVMTVFDKVKEEDRILDGIKTGGEDAAAAAPLAAMTVQLPGSALVTLFPCSRDAYLIISDLNALANNDRAPFLRLDSLPRTFTLELIESILTNHAHLFQKDTHPELLLTLRQATCPLLIKAFNDQPTFSTTLRLIRLLFVLLRQFSAELVVEVEILFSILLRFIAFSDAPKRASSSSERSMHDFVPTWQRVLAMEATRSLCSDGVLMRNLWKWFDGKQDSSRLFTQLVDTIHKLATENPGLIGSADAAHQMNQASAPKDGAVERSGLRRSQSGLYNAAAGVASAAIGGLTHIGDHANIAPGLSQTSVPGVQLIDQLDKSEAPSVPATYVYLLSLQALVNLAQALAAYALPVYSRYVNSRPRTAPRAPPSLDFDSLADTDRQEMACVREMVQQSWAPLLDSFTFFLSSKCDDILFAEVLIALRNFTNTTGALGLESPRDALIASLTRFAIPPVVIGKLMSMRSRPSTSEEMDATLSERNAACLKAVTQIAYYLSGSLGTHWRDVLETFSDAEYILRRSGNRRKSIDGEATSMSPADAYKPRPSMASISALSTIPPGFSSAATVDSSTGRPAALTQIDNGTLLSDIARVFENTTALGDAALLPFIEALCELDADHVGLTKRSDSAPTPVLNRSSALSSLATVAMLNVKRLSESAELEHAWQLVTDHMLTLAASSALRPTLRMQAASALDNLIQAALRSPSETSMTVVQHKSIDVLARQCIMDRRRRSPADVDVRKSGLDTFMAILETHGHELRLGWETILSVFDAACAPATTPEDRSSVPLIKVAFGAMQVICSDMLSKLDLAQLKLCVETLTRFTTQDEDVNVALTASGALWGITAEVSSRAEQMQRGSLVGQEGDLTDMWVHILTNVRSLTEDSRLQVRNGAISILFNILEQYSSALSEAVWKTSVMEDILLPLLDGLHSKSRQTAAHAEGTTASGGLQSVELSESKSWDESRVLAFTSTGKIVRQVLVEKLLNAEDVWARLLESLKDGFLEGPSAVSQAAIRALHHILQVAVPSEKSALILPAWRTAWSEWCDIGTRLNTAHTVFTQANLLAFVETLTPLYAVFGQQLSLGQVEVMLFSLKAVLTYAKGSERISDTDRLTPLQSAIMSRITTLHIVPAIASRVLADLAEYSTLAFAGTKSGGSSYMALNRIATDAVVQSYEQRSTEPELYSSGAVQQVFSAITIPLKLRYDCPGSAEQGKTLWKGSMLALCKIANICCEQLDGLQLSKDATDGIWTSMVDAFSAALTSDCSPILDMPIEQQQVEETFDLVVLATLETGLWPHLGKPYVPESCTVTLAKTLATTSQLVEMEGGRTRPHVDSEDVRAEEQVDKIPKEAGLLSTLRVPRELFAYWCLDLLFLLCTSAPQSTPDEAKNLRRVAALALPVLVDRVGSSLLKYIRECTLRGAAPLARVRDEEVNYLLAKLASKTLWPGSLAAALSYRRQDTSGLGDATSAELDSFVRGEAPEAKPGHQSLLALEARRSPHAMLFHFYPLLCDFLHLVVPREGGRSSVMTQATCGSSRLYGTVRLPDGFEIGQIGRPIAHAAIPVDGKDTVPSDCPTNQTPPLADPRALARSLLDTVGQAWQ